MKSVAIPERHSPRDRLGAILSRLRSLAGQSSLLAITAGFAGVTAFANAMAAGADPAPTRMGVSIQQSMGERDQALAKQKRGLELREQAARAAEARLKANLEANKAPVATPASNAANVPGAAEDPNAQPYDDLARIYQTMKPARAAPIFERLDLDVQLQIARHMRERSTALILSSMSPNAAVQLSMALAGQRMKPAALAPPPPARQVATPPLADSGKKDNSTKVAVPARPRASGAP